ncbi:MAG: response regulator, partial [Rubrivivax sp.]
VLLVVDDDPVNMAIATHMLQALQAEAQGAGDGHTALQLLAERRFDVVLMDWRMPGMDGLETTRKLRTGAAGAQAAQLPVIGFTANAFPEDRTACLAAGMDDVLVKPVDSQTLLLAVQRQWRRR